MPLSSDSKASRLRRRTGPNSGTTGGSSTIETGPVKAEVSVVNQSGLNQAEVEPCGCEPPSVTTTIKGNGVWSKNLASTYVSSKSITSQTNVTYTGNLIGVAQNSGGNEIKATTSKWWGGSYIGTGKTTAKSNSLSLRFGMLMHTPRPSCSNVMG